MTVDIGTGDGRAVLALAAARPGTLVIGVDATAGAMVEASRRAACPSAKGGLPNALFVAASAERPPRELAAVAQLVTVILPWGSLLDGVVGRSPAAAAGIASLVARGGTIQALVSTAARDRDGAPSLGSRSITAIEDDWSSRGFRVVSFGPATTADLGATGSTWAKRLRLTSDRGNGDRTAWRLELRRITEPEALP